VAEPEDKRAPGRAEAVRNAAVQAFQSTAGQAGLTRERAQELADELAGAAGRVIGALDELRPAAADDVRSLREQVAALEGRVAALEAAAAEKPAPKRGAKAKAKPKKAS
jgi:polyhydroxyalkanoate synthesis regulator phasin